MSNSEGSFEPVKSNEETLIKLEVIDAVDKEIKRLEKLKEEKSKILPRIRVIVRSCLLLARSDGEDITELEKMYNYMFNRYCIKGQTVRKYCRTIKDISLEALREDIEKYQLDSEFLAGFYNELFHIAFADGEFTKEEDKMMTNLRETFKLPFVVR